MANLKWFFLFIIAAAAVFFYMENSQDKEKQLDREYRAAIAAAEDYKVELPELPPKHDMELPESVITRLRRSLRSKNVEEASKAMDILWKMHDGEVIPAMNKYLSAKPDSCWSDCSFQTAMKIRILDIITRDVSQLNFELLCIAAADRNRDIRLRSISALSNFPTDDALEVINKALNDKDSSVRTAAMEGAVKINEGIKKAREEKIGEITNGYKKKTFKERISPEAIMKVLD